MSPGTPLLTVRDLALSRGGRRLFEGLGFALAPKGLLLLRGPNGAGKSSLLLALAGVLHLEAGSIEWGGEPPPIHLLAHAAGVKSRLTLGENLDFWRRVNGGRGLATAEALTRVGLGGLDQLDAGYLSAGQTRRLGLARLLVSDRPLWLLDEPTAALDAAGETMVAGLIAGRLETGGAVIAATHDDIPGATATLVLGTPA
jgi:heme exporter protein A